LTNSYSNDSYKVIVSLENKFMLNFIKVLVIFININQETVLNWFGIKDSLTTDNLNNSLEISSLKGLWQQIQDGLTLADIENILFFIVFLRFLILAIRYNLKTSFYITCIGIFAGYLWYRHLIDLIAMYRSMLIKLPYLHNLGIDAVQLQSASRQRVLNDLKLGENIHWYNPGQLIYYSFIKGIVSTDSKTGLKYYIDPISMFIANLKESERANILPIYYKVYNRIIPQVFEGVSKFWNQLSGIAAYAVITRIGKRYCPYLVRWHWTFLLIIGFIEQILIYFCYRISYFQLNVLIPQAESLAGSESQRLILQVNLLNGVLAFIICFHLGLILFGLFHAIWGQYFYFPFFVENTELHIGPRPKNSIYSGGNTTWQDEKEKNIERVFPKLWYGWFGRGTQNNWNLLYGFQNLIKNIIRKVYLRFYK